MCLSLCMIDKMSLYGKEEGLRVGPWKVWWVGSSILSEVQVLTTAQVPWPQRSRLARKKKLLAQCCCGHNLAPRASFDLHALWPTTFVALCLANACKLFWLGELHHLQHSWLEGCCHEHQNALALAWRWQWRRKLWVYAWYQWYVRGNNWTCVQHL